MAQLLLYSSDPYFSSVFVTVVGLFWRCSCVFPRFCSGLAAFHVPVTDSELYAVVTAFNTDGSGQVTDEK